MKHQDEIQLFTISDNTTTANTTTTRTINDDILARAGGLASPWLSCDNENKGEQHQRRQKEQQGDVKGHIDQQYDDRNQLLLAIIDDVFRILGEG